MKFDLKRFLQDRLDRYVAYEVDTYFYDFWEKPVNFLHHWICETSSDLWFWTADGDVTQGDEDIEIQFDYLGEEEVVALHESLGLNREGTEVVRVVV